MQKKQTTQHTTCNEDKSDTLVINWV